MALVYLALLLLVAVLAWLWGKKNQDTKKNYAFSKDYLIGLNYLLSEQPDKAVDIFIKLLEVDSATIETHLALGHLFRKQGEVERAIRIHQNLIAKPQLNKKQRTQAILALGQDYLSAGVLDRAERLLLDVVDSEDFQPQALTMLLDIYQQEKEWAKAIQTAEKYQQIAHQPMYTTIAQYYCELAQEAKRGEGSEQMTRYLKRALSTDKDCVRANLLLGQSEIEQGDYKQAIKYFRRVPEQELAFICEIVKPLAECYDQLNLADEYLQFLQRTLESTPRLSLVLAISDRMQKLQGTQAAAEFVAEQLYIRPSLFGLSRLIELQTQFSEGAAKYNLQLLFNVTQQLINQKPLYRCTNCGNAGKVLLWLCPRCRKWATTKPIQGLEGD